MTHIQISLPENVFEVMRKEAEILGVTPNMYARIQLAERFLGFRVDTSEKAYIVRTKNWREIEAYVRVKRGCSVENFFVEAASALMRRNALKPSQKAEVDRLLGK
jgi:hypothetical protein